jgi:RNA polymerase sigma-70 factor (ECF subfamily)
MSDVAALFAEHRPFLIGLAYRLLGSVAEAEDAVQEAFVRAPRAPDDVASPRAWLTTVVTRICLDQLKSARARRETYPGVWLPEPVRTDCADSFVRPRDPEDAETLSLAFLVLLETLSPLERAVFLLHEVFDYSHAEVGAILERDEPAVRQLLHRARAHVRDGRPRFTPDPEHHRAILGRFVVAASQGDLASLELMLADHAIIRTDGGGKATAARKPVHGASAVARFVIGVAKKAHADAEIELAEVNGVAGLVWKVGGVPQGAMTIAVEGDRIFAIDLVVNPDKLTHVG